ncbi:MAG: helix-turn-helix transcriptional regulator [Parasporobacterium sp.]|nr:helix-turn-helix transcriptional regulator [Parasporobacterium sp.]
MCASIKERLRELQGNRSAEEFGNAIGVSRQTMNYWINGQRTPSADNIKTICEKGSMDGEKISADWLLGYDVPKNPDPDIQMIYKYTGLSEKSIDMLHLLSNGKRLDGGSIPPNESAILALNLLLEIDRDLDEDYTKEIYEKELCNNGLPFISVFSHIFALIFPQKQAPNDPEYAEYEADKNFMTTIRAIRKLYNQEYGENGEAYRRQKTEEFVQNLFNDEARTKRFMELLPQEVL